MTYLQDTRDSATLNNQRDGPDLLCTDAFRQVIETLPEQHAVPASIIKLGLLTDHLEPKSDQYTVATEHLDSQSASPTPVPPRTLSRIRWLLATHTSDLTSTEKKRVGELCAAAKLNRPPEQGTTDIHVIESEAQTTIDDSLFVRIPSDPVECEHCGNEYESMASLRGHLAHCDEKESSDRNSEKRPAFGKEIRTDRGSERVSGRNPFADPSKIKDAGLHQGGK